MKERDILGEIGADVKTLLAFMNTYIEKSKHCDIAFTAIQNISVADKVELKRDIAAVRRLAMWNRKKILIAIGAVMSSGFIAGILVKVL